MTKEAKKKVINKVRKNTKTDIKELTDKAFDFETGKHKDYYKGYQIGYREGYEQALIDIKKAVEDKYLNISENTLAVLTGIIFIVAVYISLVITVGM